MFLLGVKGPVFSIKENLLLKNIQADSDKIKTLFGEPVGAVCRQMLDIWKFFELDMKTSLK